MFYGVSFDNLRKALYLLYFGTDNGACNDFTSPKYQYIIPMQGNFENPLNAPNANDTYMIYWIERDRSLTQDDYTQYEKTGYNRQKCVAHILVRFVGAQAETWAKVLRHLTKKNGVTDIWSGVCNAERLEYTGAVVPMRIDFFGKNNVIAFDVRFKLYYDEDIELDWEPLEGISMKIQGNLHL